jgi:predicted HTH transcriptional regulator
MATLQELIAQGEHEQQDFKFRVDDQKKIARTLCAFANTNGGRLLIGVKDNGKIAGTDPQEEFYMIEGAASMYCEPKIEFKTKVWQEDFRLVLEVLVERSDLSPHRAPDDTGKKRAYIRVADQTIAANKITERVWRQKKNLVTKPERFDEEELSFLRLIGQLQPVSISKLYKHSNLPLKRVDSLLVLMICWGLVEIHYKMEGAVYTLVDNFKS